MSEPTPLHELDGTRLWAFLSWPSHDAETAEERLEELRGLGVEALSLGGPHNIQGAPVLGKGHVGVVLKAYMDGGAVALKVLRSDADRGSMEGEAEMLRLANSVGVGPRLLGASDSCLVMELIEGDYIAPWVEGLEPDCSGELRRVLAALMGKARRLDAVGLDHGELGRIKRHVIVSGGEPRVIDFESASTGRRPKNVTSVTQFLFIIPRMAALVERHLDLPDREGLMEALKVYRMSPSDEGFSRLMRVLGLA